MALKTVSVPPEFEPIFAKAEDVVSRYFRQRKDDPSQGAIEIFGERYVLMRAASLSVEFFSLVRERFGEGREAEADDFARNMLFDLAHAVGKSDAINFHAKMGLVDPVERLSAGPVHFSHTGWAFVDIFPESNPSPDNDYFLIYDHPHSFEADAWARSGRAPSFPVCIMNSGYSSGWCEASFGLPLVASEVLCRAKGDPCCRFIMAPPDRIEQHLHRYVEEMPLLAGKAKSYSIPDFFARKRIEEDLRRSMEQYQEIFEAVPDGLMIIDTNGLTVEANPAAVAMHGYSREEMIGSSPEILIHPNHRHQFRDFMRSVTTSGYFSAESRDVRKDGTVFDIEVRGIPFPYNGSAHLLAILRDITDRKRAERSLVRAKEEWERTFDTVPDLLAVLDTNHRIVRVNKAMADRLGVAQDAAVGSLCHECVHGTDTPPAGCPHSQLVSDGQAHTAEIHEDRLDGDFLVTVCPLRDEEGRLIGSVHVARDITQHKRAEAEIEGARQAAETANLAKSQFLANMSHEIRTPLTAITGFASLLREELGCCTVCAEHSGCQKRSGIKEYIDTIRRSGDHLLTVINDVLDLSKIEAGKLEVERIEYSPVRLVAEVQSLLYPRAREKGLSFKIDYAGPIPETIRTDPTRLRQILVNLAGNAVKFTDKGSVRLVTSFVRGRPGLAEPQMMFDIVDTGVGMTEQDVARLYEPFTQADTSTTRKFGGTGLGLAISRRLAKMLGGEVRVVATKPGIGTHMRVTVTTGPVEKGGTLDDPMTATIKSTSRQARPPDRDKRLNARILLAEDGPDNQRLISRILEKAGARVAVVENGQVAVEAALAARDEGNPFDVVLMDMQMPVMDGYAATRTLRRQGYESPVIALTAHAMADDRQKCLDAGCDDYASKPVDTKGLIRLVRDWCRSGSTESDGADPRTEPLVSEFAGDPDMAKLVETFVENLPERVALLERALAAHDFDALAKLAHQLKGAAGGYGFGIITEAAKTVGTNVKDECDLDRLHESVKELTDLCNRAIAAAHPR